MHHPIRLRSGFLARSLVAVGVAAASGVTTVVGSTAVVG
jgi:hypothetical protein